MLIGLKNELTLQRVRSGLVQGPCVAGKIELTINHDVGKVSQPC